MDYNVTNKGYFLYYILPTIINKLYVTQYATYCIRSIMYYTVYTNTV